MVQTASAGGIRTGQARRKNLDGSRALEREVVTRTKAPKEGKRNHFY